MQKQIHRLLEKAHNVPKTILIFILIGIRPLHKALLGPAFCRYSVTCTEYAITQLHHTTLLSALLTIGKRLIACNPFNTAVD